MSERVQLRRCDTGEVSDFLPVDAKEMLSGGGWLNFQPIPPRQISGPKFTPNAELALVIGTGPTMQEEVAALSLQDFEIFGVNEAVISYKCHHLVTWHFENLWKWKQRTRFIPFPVVHSREPQPEVAASWDWSTLHGSSAMCAVFTAISMGHETVVVAGVPLSERYDEYRQAWLDYRWFLDGKVKSVGGWLAEIFGRWGTT